MSRSRGSGRCSERRASAALRLVDRSVSGRADGKASSGTWPASVEIKWLKGAGPTAVLSPIKWLRYKTCEKENEACARRTTEEVRSGASCLPLIHSSDLLAILTDDAVTGERDVEMRRVGTSPPCRRSALHGTWQCGAGNAQGGARASRRWELEAKWERARTRRHVAPRAGMSQTFSPLPALLHSLLTALPPATPPLRTPLSAPH